MFINPGKIYYLNPSDDPIFPTCPTPEPIPGANGLFYMYKEGYARVLAAVDTISWRDLDAGPQWHAWTEDPTQTTDSDIPGALQLFYLSIRSSSTYQIISQRLGSGLNASSRISGFTSLPLAREQWKVEARRMFAASLARAQFQARDIARGVYAEYPGYQKMDTDPAMCQRTYIFRAEGWSNVMAVWYLSLLIPSVIILVGALPAVWNDEKEMQIWEYLCFGKADMIAFWSIRLAGYALWGSLLVIKCLTVGAWKITRCLWDALKYIGRWFVDLFR